MARAFAVLDRFEPVYEGGLVSSAAGGSAVVACLSGEEVALVDLATGRARARVPCEGDVLTCFVLRPDGAVLVTAGRSLTLTAWRVDEAAPTAGRGWKAPHRAPVAHMAYDPSGTLVATGAGDKAVYVHDVERGYVTHALRGHGALISAVAFHPDSKRLQLFSAANDGVILHWDLAGGDGAGAIKARLESHVSAPTSLAFSPDGEALVSGGRDRVAIVWDLKAKKAVRTIACRESVEGVACVVASTGGGASPTLLALTAGESGVVRAWDAATGKCVAGGGVTKPGAVPGLVGLSLLSAKASLAAGVCYRFRPHVTPGTCLNFMEKMNRPISAAFG
ncbi:quinon protein alcohol dehydrogenase-like superfamily [Pavlovales sp. CCMP2436]|nr:quinon protein alcohol dehydrogenase-like superfamily [Pavlovales sp. CCMP2436]